MPDRTLGESRSDDAAEAATTDGAIYVLTLLAGLAVVVPTLARCAVWGAEATMGALLCVAAAKGLLDTGRVLPSRA